MANFNVNVLLVAINLLSSAAVLVHVIYDERYKSASAKREEIMARALHELAAINSAYLPWMYDRMSEQERQMIQEVINGYRG